MLSQLLKMIIAKRMAAELGKVADEVKKNEPELEKDFRKVQDEFRVLEKNIDWYCRAFPHSTICKERVQPRYNKKLSK